MQKREETIRYNFRLNKELYDLFSKHCEINSIQKNLLLEKLISDYLETEKK